MRARLLAVLLSCAAATGMAQTRQWFPDEHNGPTLLLITATPNAVAVKVAPGLVFQHFKYDLRTRGGKPVGVEVWEIAMWQEPGRSRAGITTLPEFYEFIWHEFSAATYYPAPHDKTEKERITVRSNGNRRYLITIYRFPERH